MGALIQRYMKPAFGTWHLALSGARQLRPLYNRNDREENLQRTQSESGRGAQGVEV
jgi:hypothetical protein